MLLNHMGTKNPNEKSKQWYIKNRDKVIARIKAKSDTPEAKKRKSEYDKQYRQKNKEKIEERLSSWYIQNKEIQIKKAREWKQANPLKSQYLRYKERAVKKNIDFNIDLDDFVSYVKEPCVYCGFNGGILGLDRIESALGYTTDNVVPCCKVCNYMKFDHTLENWFSYMHQVLEYQGYEITRKTKGSLTE